MLDWYRYSLKDPQSQARISIYTVRKLHAFARRMNMKLKKSDGRPLFDKEAKKNAGKSS